MPIFTQPQEIVPIVCFAQEPKHYSEFQDMIKYVLKRGGVMGTSFQVPFFETQGKSLSELSRCKDAIYRFLQLVWGLKLLEILITGGFFNHLQSSFNPNPISNEMKALGTSLDLMKVIMKILRVDCPEQPQRPLQGGIKKGTIENLLKRFWLKN